jgi:hypothetical protein
VGRKETLTDKKAVSTAIAQETIRCLDILLNLRRRLPDDLRVEVENSLSEICDSCPVLEFHPEILEKVRRRR